MHASTGRVLQASTIVGIGYAEAAHAGAVASTLSLCAPSVSGRDDSAPSPLPPQGPSVLVSVESLKMVGAGGATSLPRVPPTRSVPKQDGGTNPTPPLRSLVVAPVVHVHGVMQGDVTAVISAGYEYCFDAEHSLTPCNLVGRLFLRAAAEASRLIRLGCLSGCANEDMSAAGVPKQRVVPLPTGAPPRRTPAELAKDLEAYLHVVTLGHYAKMFALSESNVEAVVIVAYLCSQLAISHE